MLKNWSNSLKGNKTEQKGHVVKPTQFWESKRHKNLSLVECFFHFRVGTPSSGKEEKKGDYVLIRRKPSFGFLIMKRSGKI